jgi:hypothetical protein
VGIGSAVSRLFHWMADCGLSCLFVLMCMSAACGGGQQVVLVPGYAIGQPVSAPYSRMG